jgi:hypothetical protein
LVPKRTKSGPFAVKMPDLPASPDTPNGDRTTVAVTDSILTPAKPKKSPKKIHRFREKKNRKITQKCNRSNWTIQYLGNKKQVGKINPRESHRERERL